MATILAVDDRAINREFLATLLGYAGHQVLQAADGAEALALVHSRRPDLVITDVLMPTMGGVEFAHRVHEDPEIADTPIIFYTATYRVTEARALAESCRVVAVLAKPAEPQDILDAVGRALGNDGQVPLALQVNEQAAFVATRLPSHLRDLTELQRRLYSASVSVVGQHDDARTAPTEPDAGTYAFHSLSLRLAALLELDLAMSSERDPQEMLTLFCRAAQDIMNCKYAGIGVLDREGRKLQRFAACGLSDEDQARFASIDPTTGLFGRVIPSGKPYGIEDHGTAPTRLGLPEFHPPVTSLLAVPVPVRSAMPLTGCVYFADRIGSDAFDGEDEQFAITLAAQFALAYGNFTLYDEVQQRAATLEIEIAARRRAQDELAYRMTHDQTTGLPRFVLIEGYLQAAFDDAGTRNSRVMVFYVDIDRFHTINETRGRAAGDTVLREMAKRLCETAGSDGKVAHVASDEFAVVVVDHGGRRDRTEFANELRRRAEEPIWHEEQNIYITCSVGVTCFPENGTGPQELLRQAEASMLRAKREGRNIVNVFSNEEKQALEDRATLGLNLSDAIRDGQLIVHYQPEVSARNGRILGFEALVRWKSPEFGLLPPGRFLGVAEDLGLIVDVGNFVLESVCQQARTWLDEGVAKFSISINVSSLQMQRPDFVGLIAEALGHWALPAHHIELELTENMMVGNVDRVIGTMRALKALGVQLALDDFGTGYSSLNYLRRFPIDKLKIDQSFVQDIGSDSQDIGSDSGAAGICSAIIMLGHRLGMTVLAEGVETAAQADYLRSNDCDQFQGYYFGRPVPARDAFELMRRPVGQEQQ